MAQEKGLNLEVEKPQISEDRPEAAGAEALDQKKEAGIKVSPTDRQEVLDEIEEFDKSGDGGLTSSRSIIQRNKYRQEQIEKVLAKDLDEVYLNLPADKQKIFRADGEKTAREINNLLDKAKFKIKKIVDLIRKWLSLIPGVNKFFLEQETKIKADEIIKMKRS